MHLSECTSVRVFNHNAIQTDYTVYIKYNNAPRKCYVCICVLRTRSYVVRVINILQVLRTCTVLVVVNMLPGHIPFRNRYKL